MGIKIRDLKIAVVFILLGFVAAAIVLNPRQVAPKPSGGDKPANSVAAATTTPKPPAVKPPAKDAAKPAAKDVAKPAAKDATEDEFLKEVREKEKTQPSSSVDGNLPPADADPSLVPVLETDPPAELNLGTVSNKENTSATVKVYNKGKSELVISQVKTSCGCTKAKIEESAKKIAPGAFSNIEVTINPFAIKGFESRKKLTIMSNDPKKPSFSLDVVAAFHREFSVDPESVDFGEIEKGKPAEKILTLRQVGDEPVELLSIETIPKDAEDIRATFEKKPQDQWAAQDKPEYAIKLVLTEDAAPGSFDGRFRIQTTCKRVNSLLVPVKAMVKAFYSIAPKEMTLFSTQTPPRNVSQVTVTADRAFEIVDLATTAQGLTIASKPGDVPNSMIISAELAATAEPGHRVEKITFAIKAGDQMFREKISVRTFGGRPAPQEKPQDAAPGAPPAPPAAPPTEPSSVAPPAPPVAPVQ